MPLSAENSSQIRRTSALPSLSAMTMWRSGLGSDVNPWRPRPASSALSPSGRL